MVVENNSQSLLEAELYKESLIQARSMLVVDIGDKNARAVLFDAVDNHYRMIAASSKLIGSTLADRGPISSARAAINEIENITSRVLLSTRQIPIHPTRVDGSGVDDLIITLSVSEPIRVLLAGLVDEISIASAENLSRTTFCEIIETLNLSSIEDPLATIDLILSNLPDLILITGGTDGGAEQPLVKFLEITRMACELVSESKRPYVLYAGNRALHDEVIRLLESATNYSLSANVRPSIRKQDLTAAYVSIAETTVDIRCHQNEEIKEISHWADENGYHTPAAFGRLVRFLAGARSSDKGVFGVNIDPNSAMYAVSFSGDLMMGVFPELGLGNLPYEIVNCPETLQEVIRWLPVQIPSISVAAYLLNKYLYPDSVPSTIEELYIEKAVARIILKKLVQDYNKTKVQPLPGNYSKLEFPRVEPIIAGGRVLTKPDNPVDSILTLLDGLQPKGATTLVLDPHQLFTMLGAAAGSNPALSIQVLNSNAFIHLGTVIAPFGKAKPGSPILRANMVDDSGNKTPVELLFGEMLSIPLKSDSSARLELHPLQNFDIGMGGAGIGGSLLVKGGAVGIVLDGRGRPFLPPEDPVRRADIYHNWKRVLGG